MSASLEIVLKDGASSTIPGGTTTVVPQATGAPAGGGVSHRADAATGDIAQSNGLSALLAQKFGELAGLAPGIGKLVSVIEAATAGMQVIVAAMVAKTVAAPASATGGGSSGPSGPPIPPTPQTPGNFPTGSGPLVAPPIANPNMIPPPPPPTPPGTGVAGAGETPEGMPIIDTSKAATGAAAAGGMATVATGAMAVAAGFAVVTVAAVGVAKVLTMMSDAARREAERLSGYSVELSNATAIASIMDMMNDIRRADRISPQLAAATMANARLESAINDLKTAFLEKTLPVLTATIDKMAYSAKFSEFLAKRLEIWMDRMRGDKAEEARDQADVVRILREMADMMRGLPDGGDPFMNDLLGMASNPANSPKAVRRLPGRPI